MSNELNGNRERLGPAGRLAALFQGSAITPLLALVGLLLGLFAVLVTPKEEEPQIDVTFADVYIPFPGASPAEVESLVTTPAEQVVSQIKGIDTLYSFSQPDGALLVVVFKVGVSREQAIVDLNNQLDSNRDWLPQGIGVGQPLVKPRGIDDVPIVSLTLWSKEGSKQLGAFDLTRVAHELETELKRIPGTRDIYTLGSQSAVLRVMPDPAALSAHGISWGELSQRLAAANQVGPTQAIEQDNSEIKVQVGQFLQSEQEARELVVGLQGDKPVYLGEVARVGLGEETPVQRSWMGQGQASYPAVTLAIGKQPGQNAVEVAKRVEARVESLRNRLIPAGVEVTVTRDYGVTAETKSNTLIGKLIFATTAVVLLVLVSMGWREALVVGVAIVITLALTLFASWAWGFTLNRVSLFALIFSIGILVDDAIVVVENIHRHRGLGKGVLKDLIPGAVDEVGGPTILATLTVIAALLPMAFVVWWRYRPDKIFAFNALEIVLTVTFFFLSMYLGYYCYRHLPLIDFLPYKVGVNIWEGMHAPVVEPGETETVLVYRNIKTGKLREFSLDDTAWQDAEKWEWVDTRTTDEMPAIRPLMSEFSLRDAEGDATEEIVTAPGRVYMLCVTSFDRLPRGCAKRFAKVVRRAAEEGARVVCLTPQPLYGVTYHDFGSGDVRCYNIDASTMKTMLRANNGMVVLEDGVIRAKKNCRDIRP